MKSPFEISIRSKVYVYDVPVHMSASFRTLGSLVETKLKKPPASGDLYLFMNKSQTYLKILWWQNDGWNIFARMLPRGKFAEHEKIHTVAQLGNLVNFTMNEMRKAA